MPLQGLVRVDKNLETNLDGIKLKYMFHYKKRKKRKLKYMYLKKYT